MNTGHSNVKTHQNKRLENPHLNNDIHVRFDRLFIVKILK